MKKILIACLACAALSVWAEAPKAEPKKEAAPAAKAEEKKTGEAPKAEAKDAKPADKSAPGPKADEKKPVETPKAK
jgi:hypothetical protein